MKQNKENNLNNQNNEQCDCMDEACPNCTSDCNTCNSACDLTKPQDEGEEICISLCDNEDSEIQIQKRRADEMTYQAQRIQAEFDNYRRRTAESGKLLREEGRAEVIEKLLPAMDAFGQAAKVITDSSVLQGINLISERLIFTLSQFGLCRIDSLNKEFDPAFHEAVLAREDSSPSGTIVEVLQEGYTLNGKVLRAAKVIISS